MSEDGHNRIGRRQALRRIAAAGAAAWAVPTVQTINMSRAFAQTQMSQQPLAACSWFRISPGEPTVSGALGTCGQPITPSESCLSTFGVVDCSPLLGMPLTPSGSSWTVCLAADYRVQEVALFDAAGRCWLSVADPVDPMIGRPVQSANGTGSWLGWTAAGGCLSVPPSTDAVGTPIDIAHFDMVACAAPNALNSTGPSTAATPSESPSASGSPTPSGSPSASASTVGGYPTATATPSS